MDYRNVRVVAVNDDKKHGFSIYLDFSGQREYLMFHRHNGILFDLLKMAPTVDQLRRSQYNERVYSRTNIRRDHSVKHLLRVIDEYMEDLDE